MRLSARLKPVGGRELQGAVGWSPTYRALCGYPQCREELARVTLARSARGEAFAWSATLAAGYRQYAPGHWALGRHAQRSRRHAPRRPRFTSRASTQPAPGYVRDDGVFLVRGPAGQPDLPVQPGYDPQGRRASAPQELPLALTDELTVTCARCGRISTLTVLPLMQAPVEAPSGASSGDLTARGSAQATPVASSPSTVPEEDRRRHTQA